MGPSASSSSTTTTTTTTTTTSTTTPALTGSMEDRHQEPPGAAPRLTPLEFMSTTRVTMDSVLQTLPAPPPLLPSLQDSVLDLELSTLEADLPLQNKSCSEIAMYNLGSKIDQFNNV